MRALITGGSGRLATNLIARLLELGDWDITVMDTKRPAESVARHVHFVPVDVCDFQFDVRSTDVVFHLAAVLGALRPLSQPRTLLKTNILGTANVLSTCYRCGISNIVISGSASVYGNNKAAAEGSPFDPVNMYGASKMGQEAVCAPYRGTAVEVKILRLFNIWGPLMEESVVTRFARLEEARIVEPQATRDFVHVSDVVNALITATAWDEGVYNVGTGVETTIEGLWARIREDEPRLIPEDDRAISEKQEIEILYSCADMTRTFEATLWRPQVLLHELGRKEILERL